MKKIFAVLVALLPLAAIAADRDPRVGVTSMVGARMGPARDRGGVASKNQISASDASATFNMSPSLREEDLAVRIEKKGAAKKDDRDAERSACLGNNIGIGNTFVWASKYNDTSNYAFMQEDTENPENNVCFVRVDLKSSDSRIDMSDIPSRYFRWNDVIKCGSWVDETLLRDKILEGKKKGRAWATVGGAVGGAAVGVGSMELFGNRLIGGAVEGQRDLETDTQKLKSQLLVLKKTDKDKYDTFRKDLEIIRDACIANDKVHKEACALDYKALLKI